jgi:hypothetical protein
MDLRRPRRSPNGYRNINSPLGNRTRSEQDVVDPQESTIDVYLHPGAPWDRRRPALHSPSSSIGDTHPAVLEEAAAKGCRASDPLFDVLPVCRDYPCRLVTSTGDKEFRQSCQLSTLKFTKLRHSSIQAR